MGALVARNARHNEGFTEFDEELLETLAGHAVENLNRIREVKARINVERTRLETDLHTAMNMLATGVKWEAEIAMEDLQEGHITTISTALSNLYAAYEGAYAELSYVLDDLRDPTLEQEGLVAALENKAAFIARERITVSCDFDDRLPAEVEGDLYRIGIEGMNNAVKHSGIRNDPDGSVDVRLTQRGDRVQLCIVDNGQGFDAERELAHPTGWGLRRIREIVRGAEGELHLRSEEGEGTTLCVTVGRNGDRSA
jgi:signal transduction histidine kinase